MRRSRRGRQDMNNSRRRSISRSIACGGRWTTTWRMRDPPHPPHRRARASVAASGEGLIRTLKRIHAERDLSIEIDAPASHAFQGQREDLDEMLGNLLDNACKWACARVRLTCSKEGERIVIAVDDDGPGIE